VLERFELGAAASACAMPSRRACSARSPSSAAISCANSAPPSRTEADISAERSAELRTTVARELAGVQHTVEQVVVVRYTGQDIVIQQPRDRWSA
jgi:acrylyl-CoA reductase (NADPH)/3-hydroxypropionyl-CoA dehydratase/3-hydroxypropionyl-CoA synthetase